MPPEVRGSERGTGAGRGGAMAPGVVQKTVKHLFGADLYCQKDIFGADYYAKNPPFSPDYYCDVNSR